MSNLQDEKIEKNDTGYVAKTICKRHESWCLYG